MRPPEATIRGVRLCTAVRMRDFRRGANRTRKRARSSAEVETGSSAVRKSIPPACMNCGSFLSLEHLRLHDQRCPSVYQIYKFVAGSENGSIGGERAQIFLMMSHCRVSTSIWSALEQSLKSAKNSLRIASIGRKSRMEEPPKRETRTPLVRARFLDSARCETASKRKATDERLAIEHRWRPDVVGGRGDVTGTPGGSRRQVAGDRATSRRKGDDNWGTAARSHEPLWLHPESLRSAVHGD